MRLRSLKSCVSSRRRMSAWRWSMSF